MKIVPYNQLEAKVESRLRYWFRHTGIGRISVLTPFLHQTSSSGRKVVSIGSDALAPSQMNKEPNILPHYYRIIDAKLELKNGDKLPLQVGMSLTANIKLRKVSYLQLLLGSFKEKTSALQQI